MKKQRLRNVKWIVVCFLLLIFSCKKKEIMSKETQVKKPKFAWNDTSFSIDERVNKLIATMTLEGKISQMLDVCPPIERLGIPEYNWWNEALHGVARNGRATVFPQAIGLGATFDPDLILKVGTAISDEAKPKNRLFWC